MRKVFPIFMIILSSIYGYAQQWKVMKLLVFESDEMDYLVRYPVYLPADSGSSDLSKAEGDHN